MTTVDANLFGEQTAFVEQSLAGLQAQTSAHDSLFGLGRAEWRADLNAGTLIFTNERYRAVAPLQIIGTYDTNEGSWLWGWDHPSVPPPLAVHAGLVKRFAQEHGLDHLLTSRIVCREEDSWAFAALATRLAGVQGAYRGPAGNILVMMTFGTVELATPSS
jgi:hypothetical protein